MTTTCCGCWGPFPCPPVPSELWLGPALPMRARVFAAAGFGSGRARRRPRRLLPVPPSMGGMTPPLPAMCKRRRSTSRRYSVARRWFSVTLAMRSCRCSTSTARCFSISASSRDEMRRTSPSTCFTLRSRRSRSLMNWPFAFWSTTRPSRISSCAAVGGCARYSRYTSRWSLERFFFSAMLSERSRPHSSSFSRSSRCSSMASPV
mmetsp:Transcript_14936/g.45090  ORF Transcript_14936/g.45090 Transcript_14936/m.45090 type:complete len:205 (-) Transcript_14936:200-814(-)